MQGRGEGGETAAAAAELCLCCHWGEGISCSTQTCVSKCFHMTCPTTDQESGFVCLSDRLYKRYCLNSGVIEIS